MTNIDALKKLIYHDTHTHLYFPLINKNILNIYISNTVDKVKKIFI